MQSCLLFLLFAALLLGCQTTASTPTAESAQGTFTNEEYGYQFDYPAGAEVEFTDKGGSQIKSMQGSMIHFRFPRPEITSPLM